jgi:protein-S-isoprenylcysteine O-methyltransferase Ste14
VIWTVALVAAPTLLVALEDVLGWSRIPSVHHRAAAAMLFLAFALLNVTTGFVLSVRGRGTPPPLACARELVMAGPYRYVRNPMAIAGIGQGIAVGLWLGSVLTLVYSIAGAIVWHVVIRPLEERDLSARFGRAYDVYRASVPLWWPRWRPFGREESGEGIAGRQAK